MQSWQTCRTWLTDGWQRGQNKSYTTRQHPSRASCPGGSLLSRDGTACFHDAILHREAVAQRGVALMRRLSSWGWVLAVALLAAAILGLRYVDRWAADAAARNGRASVNSKDFAPIGSYECFLPTEETYECGGVQYALDFERAFVRATSLSKPVLIYFCGYSSANDRFMDHGVLRESEVTRRLHEFECVAAFITDNPFTSKSDQERLERNMKLQDALAGEVSLPMFVVVMPAARVKQSRQDVVATSIGIKRKSEFTDYLDDAMHRWKQRRRELTP